MKKVEQKKAAQKKAAQKTTEKKATISTETMLSGLSIEQLKMLVCRMAEVSDQAEIAMLQCLSEYRIQAAECRLEKVKDKERKNAEKRFREVWDDAVIVLNAIDEGDWEELSDRGFCDYYFEDANIDEQVAELEDLIETGDLSQEFRRGMMEEMLDVFISCDCGSPDDLDIVEKLCRSKEDLRYFAELLREKDTSWTNDRIARIFREAFSTEEYMEYLQEELRFADNALALAGLYSKKRKKALAVDALWKGLQYNPANLKLIQAVLKHTDQDHFPDSLIKILDGLEQHSGHVYSEVYDELWKQLEKQQPGPELKNRLLKAALYASSSAGNAAHWFRLCLDEMTEPEFSKSKAAILKHVKKCCPVEYYCYQADQGNGQEVLQMLQQDRSLERSREFQFYIDRDHRISKKLTKQYPKEVAELYWKEAEAYGSEREAYAACARVLKELRSLYAGIGLTEEWETRFLTFVEQRKRRKYLLSEIRNQKLFD